MILFENKQVVFDFEEPECLVVKTTGFISVPAFKTLLEKLALILQTQMPRSLIFDHSQGHIITPEIHKWLLGDWRTELKSKADFCCPVAFVAAEDYFGKVSLEILVNEIKKAEKNLPVMLVENMAEACAFLAEVALRPGYFSQRL
jgi:hypothetical protein